MLHRAPPSNVSARRHRPSRAFSSAGRELEAGVGWKRALLLAVLPHVSTQLGHGDGCCPPTPQVGRGRRMPGIARSQRFPSLAAGPCARVQQRAGHAPLHQPQCHLVGAVAKAGASAARDSQGWGEQLAVGAPHRSPLRCGIPSCCGTQGITSTGNTLSTQRRPTAEDRRSLPWRSIADVLQEHGSNLTGRFATTALVQQAPLPAMFVAARLKRGADSRTPWLCSTD